jgi:membrane-bound ClpP family serine protease
MFTVLYSVLSSIALAAIFEVLCARYSGKRIYGYLLGLLVVVITVPIFLSIFRTSTFSFYQYLIGFGLALMWWFIYLNLVQSVESSMRVRILREFRKRSGATNPDEIKETYNDETLIRMRLERLEQAGAILYSGEEWSLRSRQLEIASKSITIIKKLLLNRSSQFD